jgi:hypothetical protein
MRSSIICVPLETGAKKGGSAVRLSLGLPCVLPSSFIDRMRLSLLDSEFGVGVTGRASRIEVASNPDSDDRSIEEMKAVTCDGYV